MDFDQATKEYQRLKARFENKEIGAEDFEQAVYNLTLVDRAGVEWQIGVTTGGWYRYEDAAWIEATPPQPEAEAPASSNPAGSISPQIATILIITGVLVILVVAAGFGMSMFNRARQAAQVTAQSRTPEITSEADLATASPGSPQITRRPETTPGAGEGTTAATESGSGMLIQATLTPENTPTVTETVEPTETVGPTVPAVQAQVKAWNLLNRSIFETADSVSQEWQYVLEMAANSEFLAYSGLKAVHLTMDAHFIDVISEDDKLIDNLKDADIEEVFAFPADNNSSTVEVLCRYQDILNYYSFQVRRTEWKLIKKIDDEDTVLGQGSPLNDVQNGGWARVRMRCVGNTISVWINEIQVVNATATNFDTGSWGVFFDMDDEASEYQLYYQRHSVWELKPGLLPGVNGAEEAGNIEMTLEQKLNSDGILALVMENRTTTPIEIKDSDVYLQNKDGVKFPVSSSAGGGIPFPYILNPGRSITSIAFTGVTSTQIQSGLVLVIDLTRLGLGTMQFALPVS